MTQGRMDTAQKALASSRLLLDASETDGAANRAYYAMFDAALAAPAWAGAGVGQRQPKTRAGLINSFSQDLVRSGRLAAELGRALNRVQELRLSGDYLAEALPLDKATSAIPEADRFVSVVADLLAQPSSPPLE